jgi:hypothetical protein
MSDDPILAALVRLEAGQQSLRTDFLGELGKTRAESGPTRVAAEMCPAWFVLRHFAHPVRG